MPTAYCIWERASKGYDTYYGFQDPLHRMIPTGSDWENDLGGGPSLSNGTWDVFFELGNGNGYTGHGCGCGPLDTLQYHASGEGGRWLNVAVFRKPGTYKLKAGALMLGGVTPKWLFSELHGDSATLVIGERVEKFIEADVVFDKTKSMWETWLPTAPLEEGDSPGLFPIHMKIAGKGGPYKLRISLRNVTCYPGGWTNDYNSPPEGTPDNFRLNPSVWYESLGYRGGNIEELCDFKLEKKYNEDNGWIFQFVHSGQSGIPGAGTENEGWWEAAYKGKVYPGSTIPPLMLSSYDFGASCKMMTGLANWDNCAFPDYFPQTLYTTIDDGDTAWFSQLPIPRDMETRWVDWPANVAKDLGEERHCIGIGDRLADAWEEQFVKIDRLVSYPEKIYNSIYDMLPYADDTAEYDDIFPNRTPPEVTHAGDGFINLEKYRGFYGIETTYYGLFGEEYWGVKHQRLSPAYRNMFVQLSVDSELYEHNPFPFSTLTSNYYKENSLGPFTDIASDRKYIYRLAFNDEYRKYYKKDHHPLFGGFIRRGSKAERKINDFEDGMVELNTVCWNFPSQQLNVALWSHRTMKFSFSIGEFIDLYNVTVTGNSRLPNVFKKDNISKIYGAAYRFKNPPIPFGHVYRLPRDVWFCHTYSRPAEMRAEDMFQHYNTTPDSLALRFLDRTLAHELGHFTGMKHPDNSPIDTLTYPEVSISVMNQTTDIVKWGHPVIRNFLLRDYMNFKLSVREEDRE